MKKILILIVIIILQYSSVWGRWSDNDYSDEEKEAVADVIANDANENGIPDTTDATGNPIASEVNVTDANELTDETTVEGWLDELATTVAGIVSFTWDYDYGDLINTPTIPTALSELSGDSDDISEGSTNLYERDTGDNTGDEPDATEDIKGIVELAYSGQNAANVVVQGNDYRMTDTRTPANESITTGKFVQSTLVLESEGIASNDNDTTLATCAAIKDYADSNDSDTYYAFATAGDYPLASNVMVAPDTMKTYNDTLYDPAGTDNSTDVTLNASATTGGMSINSQEISNQAATNAQNGYMTSTLVSNIETNNAKVTEQDTGNNSGDETATSIATINHGTAAKSALVDADEITGQDSENSFSLIRTTWTSVKAFLKTYFDGIYEATITTLTHEKGGLEADVSAYNGVLKITGGSTGYIKYNFGTSVAPTVDNDVDESYSIGSKWYDTTADKEYTCLDNTDGAAVWSEGGGGSGDSKTYAVLSGTDSFSIAEMTGYIYNNYSQSASATYSFATTGFTGKEGIVFKFATTENTTFDTIIDNAYINGEAASSTVTATSPPIGSEIFIDTLQTGASSWIWNFHCDPGLLVAD